MNKKKKEMQEMKLIQQSILDKKSNSALPPELMTYPSHSEIQPFNLGVEIMKEKSLK